MDKLYIYAIFDHPQDFPDNFVVVRDKIGPGTVTRDPYYRRLFDSLEQCRTHLTQERGVDTQLARMADDVPSLVECWL